MPHRCDLGYNRVVSVTNRHASGPPSSSEGEIGCLFDEIGNLVEPIERSAMDG
jgi:hypothetical protein